MQIGFDFDDGNEGYQVHPVGTWLENMSQTTAHYRAHFAHATAKLQGQTGMVAALFQRATEATAKGFEVMVSVQEPDAEKKFYIWTDRFTYSEDEAAALFAHCRAQPRCTTGAIQYKSRDSVKTAIAAVYMEGVGTLSVSFRNFEKDYLLHFSIERDTFFIDSHRDNAPAHKVPYQQWGAAYCGQTVAESRDTYPSVKSFTFNGREFVNKGGMSFRNWRDCEAYSVTPLHAWKGKTFTSKELYAAFDDGSVQRGDCRGLILKVRGVLCVLESYFVFYDDNVTAATATVVYDDDEDDANVSNDEDTTEDEEEFA